MNITLDLFMLERGKLTVCRHMSKVWKVLFFFWKLAQTFRLMFNDCMRSKWKYNILKCCCFGQTMPTCNMFSNFILIASPYILITFIDFMLKSSFVVGFVIFHFFVPFFLPFHRQNLYDCLYFDNFQIDPHRLRCQKVQFRYEIHYLSLICRLPKWKRKLRSGWRKAEKENN